MRYYIQIFTFRFTVAFCLVFLAHISFIFAQGQTAGQIVDQIKGQLTCEWNQKTVDTFKSGGPSSEITGIATTFLANLDVLKRAKAKGLNMVITHEPTFYNHTDDKARYGDDPVLKAKLKFIEENDMVIWRFHDHWHRTSPDGIYKGVISKLGYEAYQQDQTYFILPKTTLKALASDLQGRLDIKTMRVVGEPDMSLSNVGLVLGAPGSMAQIAMLKRDDVDVLLAGEAPEWETVEYVRDAVAAGMNKAIIFLGHAISEEAGMEYCAEWLSTFIQEVPIEFVPANEPFWSPE